MPTVIPDEGLSPEVKQAVAQSLAQEIAFKISELRKLIHEPVDIVFSGDVSFEIRPPDEDQRLSVYCKGRGVTTVNYTHEGVILDVFAEEDLTPVHTVALDNDCLVAPESEAALTSKEEIKPT